MKIQTITCWSKLDKKTDLFEFNHIENGHTREWKPVPKSDPQRQAWIAQAWRREYAFLVNGRVVATPHLWLRGLQYYEFLMRILKNSVFFYRMPGNNV